MLRRPLTLISLVLAGALALSLIAGSLDVSAASAGVQVTMAPVGLSLEYSTMAQDLGTGPCPSAALTAEFARLGSPPLALSGASQDLTAPAGAVTGPPPSWYTTTTYSLPANFWNQLHCLLTGAKDPLTVGINAKTGQLAWAEQMIAGARSAATNGLDVSLGNEPDLYVLPNYFNLGKKLSLQEDIEAINIYLRLASSLRQAVGSVPVIGPELAEADHWHHELPGVIGQLHEQTVGVHLYAFSACKDPRAATIQGLLSAHAAEAPRNLAWVVGDARAAHVPAIISESNSISCGGIGGVSDSPASAVWAARFVLSALKTGFQEVRFHFSGATYDPFVVRGGTVTDRPSESALFALNHWLPVGSSLGTGSGARGVVTTAVSGAAGGARDIFDNEHPRSQTVVVPAASAVVAEVLSAARAGLQTQTLAPHGGRVKLTIPANSVLAVMS